MRRLAVALLVVSAGAALSCGDPPPAVAPVAAAAPDARWVDVFESLPDLFCVLHPQLLRRDPVYGPILRRVSLLAASRSPAVAATRSIEVLESSDEVIIGMRTAPDADGAAARDGDIVVVMRGVRADFEAGKVVDASLRPLWRVASERGKIQEYVHEGGDAAASLFVLPGRTWIIATGAARQRAREALAQPHRRPAFRYDHDAPASVRLDGATFVQRNPKLRQGGSLSAIGKHLTSLTLSLGAGSEGTLLASWAYGDEDAAAVAEVTMSRVAQALKRSDTPRLRFLGGAEVVRDDPRIVTVRAKLPPGLLKDLAGAQDLPGDDRDWPTPEN